MSTHYARLLILVDDTPLGRCTAKEGIRLAKALGAEAVFLAAIPPAPPMLGEVDVAMFEPVADHETLGREQAQRAFATAQALAQEAGVPSRTLVTIGVDPAEAASQAANQHDCAMIVVGSHGRGTLARLVLGSVMGHLTQIAQRPVLVCKQPGLPAEAPETTGSEPSAA
jgi:nucleotide-binding universal stress UspA family protein